VAELLSGELAAVDRHERTLRGHRRVALTLEVVVF
jgi:hypothetical protein